MDSCLRRQLQKWYVTTVQYCNPPGRSWMLATVDRLFAHTCGKRARMFWLLIISATKPGTRSHSVGHLDLWTAIRVYRRSLPLCYRT